MCFWKKKNKKKEQKESAAPVADTQQSKTEAKASAKGETKPSTSTAATKPKKSSNNKKQTTKTEVKAKQPADKASTIEKSRKAIYRVIYNKEARVWEIKKDGAKRVIASFATKEEATNRVKELSQSQDTKFVVHKKDGKFQKK